MANEILGLNSLEAHIAQKIEPSLTDLGYELVRLRVLGSHTPTIQIMADRKDGGLINVNDCEQISYAAGAILDVDDPISGPWTLEVSSAGIDRPLTRAKDWERFAGHLAKAEIDVPLNGRKRFVGVILGLKEEACLLRLDDGSDISLPLQTIRKARLILTDALIEASAKMGGAAPVDDAVNAGAPKRKTPKLRPVKPGKGAKVLP